jgi:hypothetical protein
MEMESQENQETWNLIHTGFAYWAIIKLTSD